jgi:hypothetical protein
VAVRATVVAAETRNGTNLLTGVVPVPADWGDDPLFLRTPGGLALPTQNRVSMRGAGDVVRTLHLCGPAASAGGSQTYTVEDGTVAHSLTFHAHIDVTLRSDAPDSTVGNPTVTYSSRLLQAGANTGSAADVVRTLVRSGELAASSGTRLWGWKAWITTIGGVSDVWLVDMLVLNGNVGTPGSPLGASGILHDLFFSDMRLSLPAGYSITHLHKTPYTSSSTLMTTAGGGKLQALKQGGGKVYRFAIHTTASFATASIFLQRFGAFACVQSPTAWSWSNPETAWYGPHAHAVPEMDLSGYHPYGADSSNKWGTSVQYQNIASGLELGQSIAFPTNVGGSTPLGPYHVRGPTDGGYSGGSLITAFKGYEVVNSGSASKLKAHMAILTMDVDRSASSASVGDTGVFLCDSNQDPLLVTEWNTTNVGFMSAPGKLNSNHQGQWPRLNASQWRLQHAQANNLLPGYYAQLGNFNLYKDSHLVRALGACVPLIWLQDDPVAKEYVAHLSAWSRLRTLETQATAIGNPIASGSLWYSYLGSVNSQGVPTNVQAIPDRGARKGSELCGRIGGWAIFAQMMDWLTTSDDAKRADYAGWLAMLKAHHVLAQFKVGSRNWHSMDSGGDHPVQDLDKQWVANGNTGSANAAASQNIECGIHAGAILAVHAATDDAAWLSMLANACKGMHDYHRVPGTGTYHFVAPVRSIDIVGSTVWATQGAAPDCFTEPGTHPEALSHDNDQVGTLVAAALKHDPSHAEAWAMIYALTNTSTPEAARDALVSLFPAKMEESWGPTLAFLQTFTDDGGVTVTPGPVVMGLTAVAPTVETTDVVVTPGPVQMPMLTVEPTVTAHRPNEVEVTPGPVTMGMVAVAPSSIEVGIDIRPRPVVMSMIATLPSVTIETTVSPGPVLMSMVAVPPWNMDAPVGLESTLTARQQITAALVAASLDSGSLTAPQEVEATLGLS